MSLNPDEQPNSLEKLFGFTFISNKKRGTESRETVSL